MNNKFQFVFFLPNFIDAIGHELHFNLGISRALSILHIPHEAYVRKSNTLSLPSEWKKHFSTTSGKRSIKSTVNRFFDFSKVIIKKRKLHNLIYFLENFNNTELFTFTLSLLFFAKRQNSAWLFFHAELSFEGINSIKKICFSFLKRKFKDKFHILTSTSQLQQWFKDHGLSTDLMPMPLEISFQSNIGKTASSLVCFWPGEVRPEKGPEIIEGLLQSKDSAISEFRFILPEEMRFTTKENISWIKSGLSQEEYVTYFHLADFILLTHHSTAYKFKISYIFIETICAGKIPIVAKGTWMAKELEQYGLNELISKWEHDSFFSHLYQLKKNENIQLKLDEMKKAYTVKYSPHACAEMLKNLILNPTFISSKIKKNNWYFSMANFALTKKLKKPSIYRKFRVKLRYLFFKKYTYNVSFLNEKFLFCIDNLDGEVSWGKNMIQTKGIIPELSWMKENLIKPGDIIADIGAHQGFYALLFSKWVAQEGEVHSFECSKNTYEIMKKNLELNRATNAYSHYCAVGEKTGEILAPNATTGILLTPDNQKNNLVKLIYLDDYFKDRKLPTVLKIDVEGYEMEVLLGSKNILKTKPKINLELHNFVHEDPKPRLMKIFELISHYKEIYFQTTNEKKIKKISFSQLTVDNVIKYPNPHIYLIG